MHIYICTYIYMYVCVYIYIKWLVKIFHITFYQGIVYDNDYVYVYANDYDNVFSSLSCVFVLDSFFHSFFFYFRFLKLDWHLTLKTDKFQRGEAFVVSILTHHFFLVHPIFVCNFVLYAFIMRSFVLPACWPALFCWYINLRALLSKAVCLCRQTLSRSHTVIF